MQDQRKRAHIKPPPRPHKCDATLIAIDQVITEVERFNRKIEASRQRWDRG